MGGPELPAVLFEDGDEFRAWLAENHATSDGLLVALAKKHLPEPKLDWPRAVQLVADCAAGQLIPSQRYGTELAWVSKARAALE